MFGNAYLTQEEFKELALGFDLSAAGLNIYDDELGTYLMRASRAVDNYCHTSFGLNLIELEQQIWTSNRRIYPNNQPIVALRSVRLLIGSRQFAEISMRDVFLNFTLNYIEIVSLALTASLTAELISLGLSQIIAQYSYIYGQGEFTDSTTNTDELIPAPPGATGLTTFNVVDGTRLQVDDVIRVEEEHMLVTAIAGNAVTVLRGINHREDPHVTNLDVYRLAAAAPDEVKMATAIVTGAYIAARIQTADGVPGIKNFLIGSYSVSYSTAVDSIGGAGYPYIPAEAERLLTAYRKISLR